MKKYTDIEIVIGLQKKNSNIERWFFEECKDYFMNKFHEIFFDQDQREEIFQDSFLRLWTQIENKRICIDHNVVCRINKDGHCVPLTCSLTTFLMAIAKNEYRELIRNTKEIYLQDYYDVTPYNILPPCLEGDIDEARKQLVDDCLQQISPRCLEILTMFYIHGMSLDEILSVRKENTSKIGLKSAKYKCLNTLRDKVIHLLRDLRIDF
ncbi:MAG: sigma-70 family RNA polymerase sigma factor [Bacteroidaceae bacterium]|nr:sigma-70 family RNA polymerase sigma factor [Bacteroidaceae bacterium]